MRVGCFKEEQLESDRLVCYGEDISGEDSSEVYR